MAVTALDRPEAIFTSSDEDRRRRPADVVDLVAALLLVALGLLLEDSPTALGQAAEDVLVSLPAWVVSLLDGGFAIGCIIAGGLAVLVVVRRRPTHLGRDLLLAAVVATAGIALPSTNPDALALALLAAVTSAASPQLVRSCRRLGHVLIVLGLTSTVASESATLSEAITALAVGLAAAALVHVIFGSPAGAPSVYRVEAALDRVGITVASIVARPQGRHGVLVLDALTAEGEPLTVNAYGRDATDTQLLRRLWRFLWYRDTPSRLMLSRDEQIEHEALLTVLAGRAGIHTAEVVAVTRTSSGDSVLVLRPPAERSGPLSPAQVDEAWEQLTRAHSSELSHGRLSVATVVPGPDDRVAILDWSAGGLQTAAGRRNADGAALLAVTAVSVGVDAAADAAKRHLTEDELRSVLPFIQRPAFSSTLRSDVRAAGIDLDELRAGAATAAGADTPQLVQLRRVTVKGLLTTGLALVAGYFLISKIADIGLDTVVDALSQASIGFVLVALVFGQLPRVAQAVGTIGATSQPLPLGPTVGLQLAVTFVNLAVPSTAARVALEMRYYQKQGVGRTEAITAGTISGLAGFIVQVLLLVVTFTIAGSSLDLHLEDDDVGATVFKLAACAVVTAVVAVLVVLVVGPFRRRLAPIARQTRAAFSGILNPRHIGLLFGGNLAGEILFSLTLGFCVRALGYDLHLAELVLINESVAIFAGLMPIPGGIGVTEGALTAGLVAFGIPQAPAFAAVVVYRMVTFYLPPLWGYLSMRWLQRNSYL
jgi:uncharacterized membrane protein YbhN (UPF0104 family)